MSSYSVPELETPKPVTVHEVLLVASGDLRQSANELCWPAQAQMEAKLTEAFKAEGFTLRRAHAYDEKLKHGFIFNQRMGMDVFAGIDAHAPIVVAEAVWQYSNHVLAGLASHKGYGSPEHMAALARLGPTPLHRKSFHPVSQTVLEFD